MSDLLDPPGSSSPAAPPSARPEPISGVSGAASGTASTPALERFETCRWRVAAPSGPPYCAHGEVLPYTGTHGFRPEAWCPDCRFYKVRRGARKRLAREY